MARVEVTDGWTAAGTVGQLQGAVRRFLGGYGMRVTGEQAGEVHARRGGRLARVFGTRLARARWLPYRAVVKFQPGDGGVAVRVSVEESSGGVRLSPRLTDKYRGHFARWVTDLKADLR